MTDIVKRLRIVAHTYDEYGVHSELELEAAARIERLERDFARAEAEMKIADRNRIHFQKELEKLQNDTVIALDQQKLIDELRMAIYQYVNWVVSYEGVSFIDGIDDPPWAKLINQVWDEVKKEEGEED